MSKYQNSGPPVLCNIKDKLWRVEGDCWIETGIKGVPFSVAPIALPGERAPRPDAPRTWHSIDGILQVKAGYIGDGTSIPWVGRWLDRRASQWGWLVHDIAYEARRSGQNLDRQQWDALYADMMDEFGAYWFTSRVLYVGLRVLGAGAASPRRGPEYPVRVERAG